MTIHPISILIKQLLFQIQHIAKLTTVLSLVLTHRR